MARKRKRKDMDKINDLFNFLSQFFRWYFIVMPWEQAVFVRAGKKHKVLDKGFYFKIPFIDRVYINTKRKRMVDIPMQTVTTKDGHSITIKAGIGYRIEDLYKLYNTLFQPETTIMIMVMNKISQYVSSNNLTECSPEKVGGFCDLSKEAIDWGLADISVRINNYAVVRTFRLIQDTTQFYTEQLKMNHSDEKQ